MPSLRLYGEVDLGEARRAAFHVVVEIDHEGPGAIAAHAGEPQVFAGARLEAVTVRLELLARRRSAAPGCLRRTTARMPSVTRDFLVDAHGHRIAQVRQANRCGSCGSPRRSDRARAARAAGAGWTSAIDLRAFLRGSGSLRGIDFELRIRRAGAGSAGLRRISGGNCRTPEASALSRGRTRSSDAAIASSEIPRLAQPGAECGEVRADLDVVAQPFEPAGVELFGGSIHEPPLYHGVRRGLRARKKRAGPARFVRRPGAYQFVYVSRCGAGVSRQFCQVTPSCQRAPP